MGVVVDTEVATTKANRSDCLVPGNLLESAIKIKTVYNCLMRLVQSGRGEEGRKAWKSPKHQSNYNQNSKPQILPIKVGGMGNKHYTNLGLADCLFYLKSDSRRPLPYCMHSRTLMHATFV